MHQGADRAQAMCFCLSQGSEPHSSCACCGGAMAPRLDVQTPYTALCQPRLLPQLLTLPLRGKGSEMPGRSGAL